MQRNIIIALVVLLIGIVAWLGYTLTQGKCPDNIQLSLNSDMSVYENEDIQFGIKSPAGLADLKGKISDYDWYVDGGLVSSEAKPFHTFPKAGRYTVALKLNKKEACIIYDEIVVEKMDTLPEDVMAVSEPELSNTAAFSVSKKVVRVGQKISFSDKSEGAKNWFWEFGDSGTSSEKNPSWKYRTPGDYEVILTINDGESEVRQSVIVKDKPRPKPQVVRTAPDPPPVAVTTLPVAQSGASNSFLEQKLREITTIEDLSRKNKSYQELIGREVKPSTPVMVFPSNDGNIKQLDAFFNYTIINNSQINTIEVSRDKTGTISLIKIFLVN